MRQSGRKGMDKRHYVVCPVKESELNSLGMVKTSKSLYVSRIEDGVVRVPFYVNHSGNGVEPDC